MLGFCNMKLYFVDLYAELFRNLIKLDICDFLQNNLKRVGVQIKQFCYNMIMLQLSDTCGFIILAIIKSEIDI